MADPNALTEILRRTPEMQQAPGLAIAAYQSGGADPVGTAQTLAHVGNQQNTQSAIDQVAQHHGGRSLLGQALGGIGHVVGAISHPFVQVGGEALHLAGAPLREVQHQYRYLHDVGVRHGPITALLEGLGMGVAGAAGFVGSGFNPAGGILAAETAGFAISRIAFNDSFERTKDGEAYLDPSTHGKVSIGRDVVHLFGLKEGSKPFTFISGATDGIADLVLDPLAKVGKLSAEAKTAQGLRRFSEAEEAAGKVNPEGVAGALGRRWSGLGMSRPEDVDRAFKQYGNFRRAVGQLAGKSTGEIVTDFPKLQGIASQLGNARTEEEVLNVFKDHLTVKAMLTDVLPTRGRLSAPLSVTKERVLNWGGLGETTRKVTVPLLDEAGQPVLSATTGEALNEIQTLTVPGRGAGIIRKVTQTAHPQYFDRNYIDPTTGNLTPKIRTDGFRLGDDNSLKAVYDSWRMGGMSRRAAQAALTEYAEAGPGQRMIMFRQGVLRSMLQLGLPEDSQAILSAKEGLEAATGGAFQGVTDLYGYAPGGTDLSSLVGPAGETISAPLTLQGGTVTAFPKYDVVMKATRDMHRWSAYMGRMDQWAYANYTTRIFKRAVLLSGGFALRVAAGEILPRVLHDGFRNYVKAGILSSKVKLGLEILEEETPHIEAAVTKALGFTTKGFVVNEVGPRGNILGEVKGSVRQQVRGKVLDAAAIAARLKPEDYEFATQHVLNLGGHVVNDGLSAGHYYAGQIDAGQDLTMNLYKGLQESPTFKQGRERAFFPDDNDAPEAWHQWVKEQANDPIHQVVAEKYDEVMTGKKPATVQGRYTRAVRHGEAEKQAIQAGKEYLDQLAETGHPTLADHPRHSLPSTAGSDPHEDWAGKVLQNLKGSTHTEAGRYGDHTQDFLQSIAAGVTPPLEDFHNVDIPNRPIKIKGHEYQPMYGNSNQNLMAKWSDKIHQKVLAPTINKLAREPLYLMETKNQYAGLAALREAGMTDAEAITLAQQRAGFKMSKYIHNLEERSQFAESWRNFMPFFFAQQQAWGRAFRLLAEDPGAFRKYQLITSSFQNIGHVQKDANGVEHMVYPGSGWMGGAVPGILKMFGVSMAGTVPVSFTGDVRSLGSVLPMSETQPGVGPVASVPLNVLKGWFPEMKPGVDRILGEEGTGNILQSIAFPNATIRRLWQSQMGDNDRSFVNSSVQTIQYLSFKQDEAMRKWVNDGHQPGDMGHPNIVPGANASPIEKQEFLDKVKRQTRVNFFMKAMIGAVSPMSPQINIGDVKMNDELSSMIKTDGFALGLQNFMDKNPDASAYQVFGSQTTTNTPLSASSAAGQFMTNHMGLLKDYQYAAWLIPQSHDDFSQEVYQEQLSEGLRIKRAPQDVMNEIYIARGNHEYFDVLKPQHDKVILDLTAKGDKNGIKAENHKWSGFIQSELGPKNPVWFHDFMSGDRDSQRKQAVGQLTEIFDKGLAPDTDQSRNVKSLLDDYKVHAARMPSGPGSGPQQAVEDAHWQSYLTQLIKDKPEMKSIVQKVFKSL